MQKKTRSILEELESMHIQRDARHLIESRAENIMASAINLLDMIAETYSEADAENLTRKLLNSIKLRDPSKFKRSLGRVDEGK
jgi:DNA polymerase III delta prime subunit